MNFEFESSISIDDFFNKDRIKISSTQLFTLFEKKEANILINKSTKDLWKLHTSENGDLVVERLFEGEQ